MAYNINFQALALWIGVAAVVGGGYFVVSSDSSQQTSFNIGMEEDTVPGELTRLSVESDGEPVDGANISIDGEYIGTTNSQGIKGFETPENNFTVEASKGDISSETTFTVEDGSFSSPEEDSGDSSDDSNNSDGSDDESGDSSNEGDDSDDGDSDGSEEGTDNQDSSDDQQDSSEDSSDTVDDFTGLELDEEPLVGELRTLTVYEDGEEVSSAEVTVNGEVVGTTNAGGTITFGVPDSAEISVSTDTGLSETFSVMDYTEEEQNQRDDQNDTEDLTTGIELDSDPVSGTTNRIILYDEGDRVSGETVYLDGSELGQTGSNGAIEFEVPLKEQITVTTDYGLGSQTFNVTEDHPEPDITLLNPSDTASFDTPTGTNTDVTFEASVDITESSGTASLMIDGSEAYTRDLTSGTNSISSTQALSGGTHNWEIEVDTPEYDVSSSSRSLTVNEVEVQNGLSLQNNPVAGEYNYVRLYNSGEPVEGTEITVNGDSSYTTDSNGEVGFEVPNVQEITVSASGYSDITRTVEGYTEEIDMSFSFSETIYQGRSNTLTVTDKGSGDALSDATVYANGVEQGQTDSSGQITFTVPEENSVTVKAVKDNSDDNQSFTAEVPPIDISWVYPSDDADINDYETSVEFNLDLQEQTSYDLEVNDESKISGSLSAGSHSIDNNLKFEFSGTKSIDLVVDSDSETRTYETSFETQQDLPPIDISINNPNEGSSVNQYWISSDFLVESPEKFNYSVKVDGSELFYYDLNDGEGTRREKRVTCLETGSHQFTIDAFGKEFERSYENSVSFETNSAPPIADILIPDPSESELSEKGGVLSQVNPKIDMWACEGVDYNVSLFERDDSTLIFEETGALSSGEKLSVQKNDENLGLSSGNYRLQATADNGASTVEVQRDFEYQN